MYVGAKKVATAGLLVAFTILMMLLSSVIETNSLFFIGAASFCVGIAIREWGSLWGLAFLIASILLNLMLTPNKLYCITFGGMGLYIWLYEKLWNFIAERKKLNRRTLVLWIGKILLFNLLYVPALFLMSELLFTGKVNGLFIVVFLFVGQAVFLVYDVAYRYFHSQIWGKLRRHFLS